MGAITISDTELKLLNFDENFAAATRAVLVASDTELSNLFSIPTESNQQQEQSGEIVFETGPATNWGQRADNGALVNDYYSGILTIRLRTNRQDNGPAITTGLLSRHNEIAAKICAILQTQHDPFSDMAPGGYYEIRFIRPEGRRHFTDWDFIQDVTELSFTLEWAINPSAWA